MKRPSPCSGEDLSDGSEAEEEDNEDSSGNFLSSAKPSTSRHVETADKVVAEWVTDALERKNKDTNGSKERPALHAVALDAVPGSPLLDDPNTISPTRK